MVPDAKQSRDFLVSTTDSKDISTKPSAIALAFQSFATGAPLERPEESDVKSPQEKEKGKGKLNLKLKKQRQRLKSKTRKPARFRRHKHGQDQQEQSQDNRKFANNRRMKWNQEEDDIFERSEGADTNEPTLPTTETATANDQKTEAANSGMSSENTREIVNDTTNHLESSCSLQSDPFRSIGNAKVLRGTNAEALQNAIYNPDCEKVVPTSPPLRIGKLPDIS